MTETVFLNYDRAALDHEYFIRGRVPEWDDKVVQFQQWSEAHRARFSTHLNVAYGSGKRQKLDIFPATGAQAEPSGVLVYLHGGYWRMLDKNDFSYIARSFAPHNITTVVAGYDYLPEQNMSGMVQDACRAVNWVVEHIADFGADPAKIAVCGHSAGAQLAGQAAANNPSVNRMVGISGVYDLRAVQACFLNDNGFLNDATVAQFGAQATQPKDGQCAGLFIVGGDEGKEFERQTREQSKIWQQSGSASEFLAIPALNHATSAEQLYFPDSNLSQQVRRFLGQWD